MGEGGVRSGKEVGALTLPFLNGWIGAITLLGGLCTAAC
jgi:hypothetical protein